MRKIIPLLFPLLLIFPQWVNAQQLAVSGNVISAADNLGIPGVTVKVKGKSLVTISDENGHFRFSGIDGTDVLVFTCIGFEQSEEALNGRTTISKILNLQQQTLSEVVVTALGVKRQKREIGYTVENIKGFDLEKSNASNVVNALSGRSAGVQVINPNGVEGGTSRIVIRGVKNIFGNNQPLIVVDGVPMENDPGLTDIGRGSDWGSAVNNINPYDIEEMNILKGPAASALYGSRGANGVIMITTKRGKKQKGIGLIYNFSQKVIQPYRYREVQNEYGAGGPLSFNEPVLDKNADGVFMYPKDIYTDFGPMNESTAKTFGFYGSSVSWGARLLDQPVKWWDGEMRSWSAQPENLKMFFKNGFTSTHNLAFSGGGETGTMRVSLTRTDHKASIPNSHFDQTTITLGSHFSISSKVRSDLSLSYFNYNRLNSPMLGESENSFGKGMLYSWPRTYTSLEKDTYALDNGSLNNFSGISPYYYINKNFWWTVYNNNTTLQRNKMIGTLSLSYDVNSWLSVTGRLGLDLNFNESETRNRPTDSLGLVGGYYSHSMTRDFVTNNEFMVTLHKNDVLLPKLNVRFSAGGTRWMRSQYNEGGSSGTWVKAWVYSLNNYEKAEQRNIWEGRSQKAINSFYGFLNLQYKNYAFFELTGRNDWSSTLPQYSNSYFYPSASFSFVPTDAWRFGIPWLTMWRLRGAYALTAVDTDPYKLDFIYSSGSFGGDKTSSMPSTIPPYMLKPQFSAAWEAGTIIGLLDNHIDINLTYYFIKSYDQILNSPLPLSSGAGSIEINTGELQNKGIELAINTVIANNNKFTLETGVNFTRNRNKVVSLGAGAEIYEIANIWGYNGPAIAARAGEDYGTIIGYDYVRDAASGQPILTDDGTHYLISDNRVPVGNASPDFLAGWTTRLTCAGFTLSTLVDTKWGGQIYCGSYVINLHTGQSPETLTERNGGGLPYTDPDGKTRNVGVLLPGVFADGTPNNKVVHYLFKYMPNAGGWGHFLTTPGIVENTWIKLREVSLNYTLPDKILGKSKVFQNLSVGLVGRDLFYLYSTLPDSINPEGANGSGNAQGLEWGSFPSFRSVVFELTAGF